MRLMQLNSPLTMINIEAIESLQASSGGGTWLNMKSGEKHYLERPLSHVIQEIDGVDARRENQAQEG